MIKRTLLAAILTLTTTQTLANPYVELAEALEQMRAVLEELIKAYRLPCWRADYAHPLGDEEFLVSCEKGRHLYSTKPVDGIPVIRKVK